VTPRRGGRNRKKGEKIQKHGFKKKMKIWLQGGNRFGGGKTGGNPGGNLPSKIFGKERLIFTILQTVNHCSDKKEIWSLKKGRVVWETHEGKDVGKEGTWDQK